MEETQIDIRAILGVLRRHLRLIFLTFVAIIGLASVVSFSLKPMYTASAWILVDTSRKNLLQPDDALTSPAADSARVDSEVQLAKSDTVLLQVVDQLKLFQEPEYAYHAGMLSQLLTTLRLSQPKDPSGAELLRDALGRLRDAVFVQRVGLTYVIAIQAKSSNRDFAAKLANAVATEYIAQQLQSKIDSTLAGRDTLQARLADASAAVATSDDAVDHFIGDNIAAIESETGQANIGALNGQIASQSALRTQLSAAVDAAAASLKSKDYDALTASLQSEAVSSLEAKRQQTQASLNAAAEGSQAAFDLKAQLAKVEQELDAAAASAITGLQGRVSDAQAQESDLRSQLRTTVLSSHLSSSTLTRIYALQQSAEIARTQYQTLLKRLNDLDQQAYVQVADSRVASQALPPDDPSFPNIKLILALAAVAGLAGGVGLAFLYENVIGGIVSEDQLRNVARTRVTLTVPRQKELRGTTSLADITLTSPLSAFAESIRRIRAAADQSMTRMRGERPSMRGDVLLVTSAAPNEGKSTTSLALARAYALAGKTVLLVDCDLRKPSLHQHLGQESTTGLIDYLRQADDSVPLGSVVGVDAKSGIGVLLGSRRSNTATDQLIAGPAFGRLIEAAVKAFDVVILDTPPVGPVVDGLYLAQYADALIFVVRWATTSQAEVRSALRTLSDAKREDAEVIAVLAQSARKADAYYGRYYGYYTEPSGA